MHVPDQDQTFDSPWFTWVMVALLALVGIATLASLIPGPQWYLRMFDFVLEVLLYVCLIYCIVSYAMSRASRNLEVKLGVGQSR